MVVKSNAEKAIEALKCELAVAESKANQLRVAISLIEDAVRRTDREIDQIEALKYAALHLENGGK